MMARLLRDFRRGRPMWLPAVRPDRAVQRRDAGEVVIPASAWRLDGHLDPQSDPCGAPPIPPRRQA